ncbi:MAG: hypothetical protein O3A57_10615 [Bacteroidetes bacterium]|nr:hypothetical protein [Bacteroidota bacterium]
MKVILSPLLLLVALAAGCTSQLSDEYSKAGANNIASSRLYVWAADEDQGVNDTDFLALIDSDPTSETYGEVVSTSPVGAVGTGAHHAEPIAPTGAFLFANGYKSGRTFLFDLSDPGHPTLSRELEPIDGYHYPHSFLRLKNGLLLATLQYGNGTMPGDPGGLAQFDQQGVLMKVTTAADPNFEGEIIRPYAVEAVPEMDRVVTTGRTMNIKSEVAADLVQIWRLSDLALLETIRVPRVEPAATPECVLGQGDVCSAQQYAGEHQPFESRALSDGSVFMNTLACGIYRISGLEKQTANIELVVNYPELLGCSVPAVAAHYIILPVMFSETILVFDVHDPKNPIEVSRFDTPGYQPHWAAADPGSSRIVVTSSGPASVATVLMLDFDEGTGKLSLDENFGSPSFPRAGVSFYRDEWPHGSTGTAIPHAALFGK